MTLALIVLIVFLVAWMFDSSKKKKEKLEHRKKTITNVKLQDQLYKENFVKIMNDLAKMDSETFLTGDTLIDALEFLYTVYDIPDNRTEQQKTEDRVAFKNDLKNRRDSVIMPPNILYPQDESQLTLPQRIWCVPYEVPHIENTELLFGNRNSKLTAGNFFYMYDSRGIPGNIYQAIPAKILGRIAVMLTRRDLKSQGFNYSWNRQESLWQWSETVAKEQEEKKKKYPWLY